MPTLRCTTRALAVLTLISLSHAYVHESERPAERFRNLGAPSGRQENRDSGGIQASCLWYERNASCQPHLSASAALLQESDSAYAQFVANLARCSVAEDEKGCENAGSCLWNGATSECQFVEISAGHKDSRCVRVAPASIDLMEDSLKCLTVDNDTVCDKSAGCYWGGDSKGCLQDPYQRLFGFSQKEFTFIVEYKTGQYREAFKQHFHTSSAEFNWNDVLEWELPEVEVPTDLPETALVFADAVLKHVVPFSFYCRQRYIHIFQFPKCLMNPRCDFDYSSLTCTAHLRVKEAALSKAYHSMDHYIDKAGDKEFVKGQAKCIGHTEEDECSGVCQWQASTGCRLKGSVLAAEITALGDSATDPVCLYLTAKEKSECTDLLSTQSCLEHPECALLNGETCTMSAESLVAELLETDAVTKPQYKSLQEICAVYEDADSCHDDRGDPVH